MVEMLGDETTVINGRKENREELADIIFSTDGMTLADFMQHIHRNGSRETIINPRAYLKKCWIDYIRSNAI